MWWGKSLAPFDRANSEMRLLYLFTDLKIEGLKALYVLAKDFLFFYVLLLLKQNAIKGRGYSFIFSSLG